MPGDEDDLLVDHLVGDGDRLFRFAGVVADLEHELFAEDAAGGVDVGDRHFGATHHLFAEDGVLAGDRPGGADEDLAGGGTAHEAARQGSRGRGRENAFLHRLSPYISDHCQRATPTRRAARATADSAPPISPCAPPFQGAEIEKDGKIG